MRTVKRLLPFLVAFALLQAHASAVSAAGLSSVSLAPHNSLAGATQSPSTDYYRLQTSNVSVTVARCIAFKIDVDGSFGSAGLPAGMTVTSSALTNSTAVPTPAGWGTGAVSGNTLSFINSGGEALGNGYFQISGIHNPTTSGTYFVQVQTYANTNCNSSPIDTGIAAFAITDGTIVTVSVDPTLTFTVTSQSTSCNGVSLSSDTTSGAGSVSIGHVGAGSNAVGAQSLAVTSNAVSGYTVYARYSGQMADQNGAGPNHIADLGNGETNANPGLFPAAGNEAFGYTTSDTSLSATGAGSTRFNPSGTAQWAALTTSNAEVAYSAAGPAMGSGSDQVCVAYQVGAGGNTLAGNYATTVTYTAVPIF